MGWIYSLPPLLYLPVTLLIPLVLGFIGAPLYAWTIFVGLAFFAFGAPLWMWVIVGAPLLAVNVPNVRQWLLSMPILKLFRALDFMPTISETERTALEAGSTWVEAELFSGKPNFDKIFNEPYKNVSEEEQAFLDGPCETVCKMFRDWDVYKTGDLPDNVWEYLKKERFFGMIIPKEYGGLGFSGIGHSEVIGKLSTRSVPLGITVMVPNSLGPGELIAHYGTQDQKDYYLPRLAKGEEIPCFGLTEPHAGSDAGSMQSTGVIFKGEDGELHIRLNWDKRYITLAAISTIIGLAVKIRDPENFLGKGEDLGITCVLVPSDSKGVVLGKRHNPMGVPFYNCPTQGEDVVVSIKQVIGGQDGVGRGWQMLMESLAAGRSISLPAQSSALGKAVTAMASAHALTRRQFGISIGKFEGIEEPLARIVGLSYMIEAARVYTCGAVDTGVKPSVVSAMMKYNSTELSRIIMNDGMDILAGNAISRGPKNVIANAYQANPIGITVEGANILTRTMIVFGQGAIRCHPYAYREFNAVTNNDIKEFDSAFWGHIAFVVRNVCRSVLLSLTRGFLAPTPGGPARRYYQKLAWSSATFAILADLAMGVLGGKLKFKEKLTGRYADVMMWMFFISASIRRFEAEGRRADHWPVVQWGLEYGFARMQEAFDGIYENFDAPILWAVFRGPLAFWSRLNRLGGEPTDWLGHRIAKNIQVPGEFRDSLTTGLFIPRDPADPISVYERAFKLVYEADGILKKITKAVRSKKLPKDRPTRLIDKAVEAGVISQEEANTMREAEAARNQAISVDSFDTGEFRTANLESSDVAKLA